MKLYGSYTSPFVRHCRIALLETGLACEFIETDAAASASQSPTQRVPFLQDGDIFLSDSSSILKYVREKSGNAFCETAEELNQFCMVNTALDATVNLFFLERDGVDINAYAYTKRQAARIETSLAELNQLSIPQFAPYNDAQLRLACYLAWGLFRKRINLDNYDNLARFLDQIGDYENFAVTAPPV